MHLYFCYNFFHLIFPRKMFNGLSDFSWIEVVIIYIVNYLYHIDWRFIGWCLDNVWFVIKVAIIFRIDE